MSSYSEEDVCKLPEPDFVWDITSELALYQALLIHKPAGINKHFAVALVADKLTEQLMRPVLASAIWKKLRSMFDLRAVEDREESIPFSLEAEEFCLPRRDFESLLLDRRQEWRQGEKCRPPSYFSHTPSTPKSEGSESRSSPPAVPVHHRDVIPTYSSEEEDLDSDIDDTDSDGDESYDNLEVESTKSDSRLFDDTDETAGAREVGDKEALIAQARDEIEKKLQPQRDRPKPAMLTTITTITTTSTTTVSAAAASVVPTMVPVKISSSTRVTEPRTPRDDDKVAIKRHITRSTPGSTPNKRRK